MPIPAPIIAAGLGVLGQGISGLFTSRQNRKSQEYATSMYELQKRDNRDFWNLQNEYNAPVNQVKRIQEAGLNPALLYGSSAGGVSGQASPIKTPDVQGAQFRAPNVSAMSILDAYYNTEIRQAQVDNLRLDGTTKIEEARLKAAQTDSIIQGTKRSKFDLDLDSELRSISADMRRENLRSLKSSTDINMRRDEREAIMNSRNVKESIERVANMRLSRSQSKLEMQRIRKGIQNLTRDIKLKDLDIGLRKDGIMPHDPMYARILVRLLDRFIGTQRSLPFPKGN